MFYGGESKVFECWQTMRHTIEDSIDMGDNCDQSYVQEQWEYYLASDFTVCEEAPPIPARFVIKRTWTIPNPKLSPRGPDSRVEYGSTMGGY